eukprot:CAMPEP_0198302920 /NCGR_PEP_ID=MMETSP1449-20131203/56621_1 /TAXON_ID=420275 /ORGANISM="Attheya septentrionalis, Strain CCMP2084" /LENGTH=425 /DNA_ID=CAMNT_0044005399 /DNA_START=62 /DNA_END=1339 /DNA_ORIENTATION=-
MTKAATRPALTLHQPNDKAMMDVSVKKAYAEPKKAPLVPKVVSNPPDNTECPIFLRKTYHMIDTCDPEVASWSGDGETFVVKNTDVFEKKIIPQFFKHSKFSSFVRQLNFYGFRKIKYSDTIKIDPKLEAATANFWRFRHAKFQRGKPEQLIEITRSNGQSTPASPASVPDKPEQVKSLKTEVTTLKQRIESMSKNLDDLTSMVQTLTVSETEKKVNTESHTEKKRKTVQRMDSSDWPENVRSGTKVEDISFTPGSIFPAAPYVRQNSVASNAVSDQEFVDDLFTAFDEDEMDLVESVPIEDTIELSAQLEPSTPTNKPDLALMNRLSDALTLLPKNAQELLVERLVATITSTEAMKNHVDAVSALTAAAVDAANLQAQERAVPPATVQPDHLPLAAATLGALLCHYGHNHTMMPKSLPVIPMHA